MDAVTGHTGVGAMRRDQNQTEVYLQLQPGQSIIVRTLNRESSGARWTYERRESSSELLVGTWKVDFISGGPQIPAQATTQQLGSWTELGGSATKSFSGTARYSIKFDTAALHDKTVSLDLGNVSQSAWVKLNGKDFGTLFIPPYRVTVDNLKPRDNELEVEVTSTSANRIRELDQRGVKWQNFYDINFVNQDYKPFNAANWPVTDSGLLGPVTLTDVKEIKP